MKYWLFLTVLLAAACAWHYPITDHHGLTPEAIHPSPERIAQLLGHNPHLGITQSVAFLRLSSPFVFAGHAVLLTCFVPLTADHRSLRLALVDVRSSTQQVTSAELLIQSVPCGDWLSICDDLGTFGRVLSHQEQTLESKGDCH